MSWDENLLIAKNLLSKGLFYAASSLFQNLEGSSHERDTKLLGELYDNQGTIYLFKFLNYEKAVYYFANAIENAHSKDARVRYTIHLGTAYRKLSEFDTWSRYLTNLSADLDGVSEQTKGLLFANLSAIQGISGFYHQAIRSIDKSFEAYSGLNSPFESVLDNNKGLAYLELGEFEKAEFYLKRAIERSQNDIIEPLSELGRLYLLQGRLIESIHYAQRALSIIWSSIIQYNKEELALLCNLLAHIAIQVNQQELATRLAEKAQVFFGQLGLWRQWQTVESQLEKWQEVPRESNAPKNDLQVSLNEIRHFLQLLEALNSQELIHKRVSQLLDVRGYYAQLFARELNLSEQEQEDLVLASRFADYGLTALETEVIMNPTRSEAAFEQYKQHPTLSVRMVQALSLSQRIEDIIEDHHENYDGSGYPKGKKGAEINYLSRVLSLVDHYANGIVMVGKSHFELMDDIASHAGAIFDPAIVNAFVKMHDFIL